MSWGRPHLDELRRALPDDAALARVRSWGERLAALLRAGGRLLAVGNGGSAAHAQHLTAELVGRYVVDRPPFSAIALHADTSALTALVNDYPADELFARQVAAHGRAGDVLVALSTSGSSSNVIAAVEAARRGGLATWAVTGRSPNPLAVLADSAVCVDSTSTPTIQEVHQVVVHLLCEALDETLGLGPLGSPGAEVVGADP